APAAFLDLADGIQGVRGEGGLAAEDADADTAAHPPRRVREAHLDESEHEAEDERAGKVHGERAGTDHAGARRHRLGKDITQPGAEGAAEGDGDGDRHARMLRAYGLDNTSGVRNPSWTTVEGRRMDG